jgi:hypothetical protein
VDAEAVLHVTAVAGKVWSGVEVAKHDQVDRWASTLAWPARARGVDRQVGRDLTGRRDAALVYPSALHDPSSDVFDGLGQLAMW